MTILPFSTQVKSRSRGYIPHWELDDAIYFVTYRLTDSLPTQVLQNLEREHQLLIRQIGDATAVQRLEVRRRYLRRLNAYLDSGHGECHLLDPRIAQTVVDNWMFFERERYRLIAWCVMPNHVHVVMRHFEGRGIAKTIKSWKGYTGRRANQILNRTGQPFWFREYYDYCPRNERELQRIVEYVVTNPSKIGLKNWPFVGTAGSTAGGPAG
jgi:REP element-mobilizing transposase RayT